MNEKNARGMPARNRERREAQARRVVFVGCQFCGETDKTLRNHGDGKICPRCLKRQTVPDSGTKEVCR